MDGTLDQLLVLRGDGILRLFDGSWLDYSQMMLKGRSIRCATAGLKHSQSLTATHPALEGS